MTQRKYHFNDKVMGLVKDAMILKLKLQVEMSLHTKLKTSFSKEKREQSYKALEEMQKKLASVNTETMKTSIPTERFIIFRAKFLMFEHEFIDFINYFHIRVFNKVTYFERDTQRKIRPLFSTFGT